MTDKDGGPAFPNYKFDSDVGMSLRDYFAASAIARTYIPMDAYPPELMQLSETRDTYAREVATEAYRIADAMLAEREE